ncbi:hypothetical protein PAPYR_6038 [Paratrimastix pyriformis]|uniref:CKK domain-containing protein n=1 Tax=Paratrimastix pyriformis TaxID=342808 RepID=A0ABQ8ULL8_9EUKA|nr:hypothetical protein PAPYR_6038 [Paratrimastix pyriformis]
MRTQGPPASANGPDRLPAHPPPRHHERAPSLGGSDRGSSPAGPRFFQRDDERLPSMHGTPGPAAAPGGQPPPSNKAAEARRKAEREREERQETILQADFARACRVSNRARVERALQDQCLSGNKTLLDDCLQRIEESGLSHFLVLLRDQQPLRFGGLYGFDLTAGKVRILTATAAGLPPILQPDVIKEGGFLKYDVGAKQFRPVEVRSFGPTVDGAIARGGSRMGSASRTARR